MVGVAQLDAAQRRTIDAIVKGKNQNHWVQGFAGTGKTIVLTHVLKRLASEKSVRVCFATFTHALKEMVESGLTSQELKRVKLTTFDSLAKVPGRFDVLVADEFQDIRLSELGIVKKKTKKVTVSADSAQRIYRWSASDTEITRALQPIKAHKLRTIHRINLPVHTVATTIHPDSEFSPGRTPDDDREPVRVMTSLSRQDEANRVLSEATRLAKRGMPSAILLPSNAHVKRFLEDIAFTKNWGPVPNLRASGKSGDRFGLANRYLERKKSPLQLFGSQRGSLATSDRTGVVYLMTYHNAKGLEFPYVFLPHLTSNTVLNPAVNASSDEEAQIFFVAATRAKERLFLSYHGRPHIFVDALRGLGRDIIRPYVADKRRY